MADTTTTAPAKAAKTMKVVLKTDVWVEDPANPENTIRLATNIPELDENGLPKVDPKSRQPIVTEVAYEIDADFAKRLIKSGQAYLPE